MVELIKPEPEFLTPEELSIKINMSLKFVKKHIQSRRLPGLVKCGRYWRINRIELEKKLLSGKLLLDI